MPGPTFAGKGFLSGSREGSTVLYSAGSYPFSALGEVSFVWKPLLQTESDITDTESGECWRTLWIWTHPSSHGVILAELKKVLQLSDSDGRIFSVAGGMETKPEQGPALDELSAGGKPTKRRPDSEFSSSGTASKRLKTSAEAVSNILPTVESCVIQQTSAVPECQHEEVKEVTTVDDGDVKDEQPASTCSAVKSVKVNSKINRKAARKKKKKKPESSSTHPVAPPTLSKVSLTRTVYSNDRFRLESLKDDLCRFRLIGSTAHQTLVDALTVLDTDRLDAVTSSRANDDAELDCWWRDYYCGLDRQNQRQLLNDQVTICHFMVVNSPTHQLTLIVWSESCHFQARSVICCDL